MAATGNKLKAAVEEYLEPGKEYGSLVAWQCWSLLQGP